MYTEKINNNENLIEFLAIAQLSHIRTHNQTNQKIIYWGRTKNVA